MGKTIKPKRKIIINPMNGNPDMVTDNNFSYETVPINKKLVVYQHNQMTVFDEFQVDGDVDLHGALILEE